MAFKDRFKVSHQFIIIWLSICTFVHNILMSGANNVVISSLQKEFFLTSRETGIYVSFYDIGSLVSSLIISFACARGSKPFLISLGMFIVFLGCMVNVLPHFIKPYVDPTAANDLITTTNSSVDHVEYDSIELCNYTLNVDEESGYLTSYFRNKTTVMNDHSVDPAESRFSFQLKHLLYVGNLINGMSTASLTTITFAYIEDIAPHSRASIYETIYFMVGATGVGVGFIITSKFLNLHTDINTVSNRPSWLTPSHPNWIGAWWIPFLIFGIVSLFLGVGILLFPEKAEPVHSVKKKNQQEQKQLETEQLTIEKVPVELEKVRKPSRLRSNTLNLLAETMGQAGSLISESKAVTKSIETLDRIQEGEEEAGSDDESTESIDNITLFKKSIGLLTKPVYVFVVIIAGVESLLANSFLAFAPLFLEFQYRLPSGSASLVLGFLSMPSLLVGGLMSGLIVQRLKDRTSSCLKFLAVALFLNLFVYIGFVIYCKESLLITPGDLKIDDKTPFNVSNNCGCDPKIFKPVCLQDSDDTFFQSACLAGCIAYDSQSQHYFNCTQVPSTIVSDNYTSSFFSNGLCETDSCFTKLIISYVCIAMLMFLNALVFLPYLKVTIGCIGDKELNSVGLGIKQFLMTAFGTIPGPIIFGSFIDSTCTYWHTDENDQSVCRMYNNQNFSLVFGLLGLAFRIVCLILVILSIIIWQRKHRNAKN